MPTDSAASLSRKESCRRRCSWSEREKKGRKGVNVKATWNWNIKLFHLKTLICTDLDEHEIVIHEVEIVERLEKPGVTGEGHGVGGGGRISGLEVVMLEDSVGGRIDEPSVVRHENILVT